MCDGVHLLKLFNVQQTRNLDAFTLKEEDITSLELIERAAKALFFALEPKIKANKKIEIKIFAGPGNNGADGLALARLLKQNNYKISVYVSNFGRDLSQECAKNLANLQNIAKDSLFFIENRDDFPQIKQNDLIIDALFGSGLNRPLLGLAAELANYINQTSAEVIAIDIPSGLASDLWLDGPKIEADLTLSFALPKLAFFLPDFYQFIGDWQLLDIGLSEKFIKNEPTSHYLTEQNDIKNLIKPRNKFDHKGIFGRALLVVGSLGKIGSAILATKGCLRAGVGLLTVQIPRCGYISLQTAVPETMVELDNEENFISQIKNIENYDAIGLGSGLGQNEKTVQAVTELLEQANKPLLIDADAINIISNNKNLLTKLPVGSILTPHLKEFERLAGPAKNGFDRLEILKDFCQKYQVIVVLKGAYSAICRPDRQIFFNSSGNPGLAKGGSGDVLTGVVTALLAQGYSPFDAALIGVFVHGMAADLAIKHISEHSLLASEVADHISQAFLRLNQ